MLTVFISVGTFILGFTVSHIFDKSFTRRLNSVVKPKAKIVEVDRGATIVDVVDPLSIDLGDDE